MGNIFYREKSLINYISTAAATGSLPADDQKYRYATSQQIGGVIYGLPYGLLPYGASQSENNRIIRFEPKTNNITYIDTMPTTVAASGFLLADDQAQRYATSQQIGGVIYGLPCGSLTAQNDRIIRFEPRRIIRWGRVMLAISAAKIIEESSAAEANTDEVNDEAKKETAVDNDTV